MSERRKAVPEHQDPSFGRTAKAPFSFVPLPGDVLVAGDDTPRFDTFHEGRYSGHIDLLITCETPTYVRCAAPPGESEGDAKANPRLRPFFHQGDERNPVIPGSSIRGMVRTLVEVMAFAKMQWFSDRQLVFRDVSANSLGALYRSRFMRENEGVSVYPVRNVKAGYLRRRGDRYLIQPAKEHLEESFVRVDYSTVMSIARPGEPCVRDVWLQPVARKVEGGANLETGRESKRVKMALATRVSVKRDDPEMVPGKLVVTGHVGNIGNPRSTDKHMHCIVYEPDEKATALSITREMWELYEDDSEGSRGGRGRLNPEKHGGDPVFYLIDDAGRLVFFGPTMLFRLPYPGSVADHVPEHLRAPAIDDMAESLFGVVRRGVRGTKVIRGRVRFMDAKWTREGPENPFYGDVSPKILGGPKPTAFQEYLTQPAPEDLRDLLHWGSPSDKTAIRGHKFYWHKPWSREKYWETEPQTDSQHTVIRPVLEGTIFQGKVLFENLTSLELGALWSAVKLPENMRHKIGMGKPLGMGTVRIKPRLQLTDRRTRYSSMFNPANLPETGDANAEYCNEVVRTCAEELRKAVISHHNSIDPGRRVSEQAELWEIPRLSQLAALLTKDPMGAHGSTEYFDYPPLATDARGRPGIDGRYWRRRCVVPTPKGLLGLLDEQERGARRHSGVSPAGAAGGGRIAPGERSGSERFREGRSRVQPGRTRTRPPLRSSAQARSSTQRPEPQPGSGLGGYRRGDFLTAEVVAERTGRGKALVRLPNGALAVARGDNAAALTLEPGSKIRVKYWVDGTPHAQVDIAPE